MHTKDWWSVLSASWQHTLIYDETGTLVCRLDLEDWGVTEDSQDELEREQAKVARRIVACVNALSGLSTEDIEAGVIREVVEALAHLIEFADSTGQGCAKQQEDARAALSRARPLLEGE